jgi:hypothetical protein
MIRRGQEGWHAKIEPPSLDSPVTIICDEAKSIPDPIFEAFSGRCTFNALLYISSTGEMGGAFARSQDKGSDFIRYHITYADCEHILDKKRVEALKTFYPADDPFLRSTLYAEFMDHTGDAGRFCSLAVIRKWIENPAEERSGETVAFCDFAGGGNENVLAIRRGIGCGLPRRGGKSTRWSRSGNLSLSSASRISSPIRSTAITRGPANR